MCRNLIRLYLLAVAVFLVACGSKQPERKAERLVLLPFENLSSDTSLDWMSRAMSGILTSQLAGSRLGPVEAPTLRDAEMAQPTEILQGYFELRGDRLRASAVVRDVALRKTVRTLEFSGPRSAGILPLADSLAHSLLPEARPFSTRNENAARELFLATEAGKPDEVAAHVNAALAADPSFAAAHLARVQYLQQRGDSEGAKAALAEARKHSGQFSPQESARLELLASSIEGNQAGRAQSLEQLSRLNPNDVGVLRSLAETNLARKNYAGAVQALQAALKIEPANKNFWNSLAYAQAYLGDAAGAEKALGEYARIAPDDANVFDSRGEVNFLMGRYADAEKAFLDAHLKNSTMLAGGDLYRAALSRVMAGDLKRADELFKTFLDFRKSAGDQILDFRTAIWHAQTGRTAEAIAELGRSSADPKTPREVVSIVHSQLCFLYLESGERAKARDEAGKALAGAVSAAPRTLASICTFLTAEPAPAAEWKARAARALQGPAQARARDELVAYGVSFSQRYAEAIPLWKAVYDTTSLDAASPPLTMLAQAYAKTGQGGEAAALLRLGIFLQRLPEPGLDALVFPRFRALLSHR